MKKLSKVFFIFMLVGVLMPVHHHDVHCGFDPITEKGCMYEISLFQNNGPFN